MGGGGAGAAATVGEELASIEEGEAAAVARDLEPRPGARYRPLHAACGGVGGVGGFAGAICRPRDKFTLHRLKERWIQEPITQLYPITAALTHACTGSLLACAAALNAWLHGVRTYHHLFLYSLFLLFFYFIHCP